MANQEHLAILKQGVKVWNRWREEHPTVLPDLSRADLRKLYLHKANLSGADLHKALLGGTNLSEADLNKAVARRISTAECLPRVR